MFWRLPSHNGCPNSGLRNRTESSGQCHPGLDRGGDWGVGIGEREDGTT